MKPNVVKDNLSLTHMQSGGNKDFDKSISLHVFFF